MSEETENLNTNTIQGAMASFPSGGTKVLLQFNKVSGAWTAVFGYMDSSKLNQEFFVYVEWDNFDFQRHEVRGTYPNFEVVDREQATLPTYERLLDLTAQQKITKAYPVINQVNNIGNAIVELGRVVKELMGGKQDEALDNALKILDDMNDYITEVKLANNLRKEFYAASPDHLYITLEEEQAAQEAQLEGGLHEAYGAKEIIGGSVF